MANTIEYIIKLRDEFSAKLGTLGKGVENNLSGIKGRFDALAGVMKGDFSQLENVFSGLSGSSLMAVGAIGAVATATVAAAKEVERINTQTIAYADSLRKVSAAANVSGGWLSSFSEVADDLAVSQETVNTSMLRLSATIGSGEFKNAMAGLIPDATLANIKNAQDAIPQLADVFQRLGPGPEAAALAIKMFGRAGQELIPVLVQGSTELNNLQQAAVDSGAALTDSAMKQADALRLARDNFADLRRAKEQAFAISVGMQAELTWFNLLDQVFTKNRNGATALGVALATASAEMTKIRSEAASTTTTFFIAANAMEDFGMATRGAAGGADVLGGELGGLTVLLSQSARAAYGATVAFGNLRAGMMGMAGSLSAFNQEGYSPYSRSAIQMRDMATAANETERALAKVSGGYGGVSAAASAASSRINDVTSAFSGGATAMDNMAQAQTALSLATGQTTPEMLNQQRAAAALNEAYKSGALTLQQVVGVTAALAKGTISSADAFDLAGAFGEKYRAEVQGVIAAAGGADAALKKLLEDKGKTTVTTAEGKSVSTSDMFKGLQDKTVTATVQVNGLEKVDQAEAKIKGMLNRIVNMTVNVTTTNHPDNIN